MDHRVKKIHGISIITPDNKHYVKWGRLYFKQVQWGFIRLRNSEEEYIREKFDIIIKENLV